MASPRERGAQYMERLMQLEDRRLPWVETWEEVSDYAYPRRSQWDNLPEQERGKKAGTKIFDSRAQADIDLFSQGLMGYAVGPSIDWFTLQMKMLELQQMPGVADWLETCERIMYQLFHRSNFYNALGEYLPDGISIGLADMFVEERIPAFNLRFVTIHPRELFVDENINGIVDTIYRSYWIGARNAVKRYGDELPKTFINEAEEMPFKQHKFVHVVEPREDRIDGGKSTLNLPVASVEIMADEEKIVRETGYHEMPHLPWRYRTNTGEVYPRSPAIDSLSGIKRLQQVAKDTMRAGQKAVDPPLNVPAVLKGKERIIPSGYNYYTDPTKKISAIYTGIQYPVGKDVQNDIRQQVDDHYYRDFFVMLTGAERQMTAREIIERQGEKAAVLSPIIARLNSEFLEPLIGRVFNICVRAGWFPPPPPVLVRSGASIDVEFVGPLAKVQRFYQHSQNAYGAMSEIVGLSQIKPEILDNIDFDEYVRSRAEAAGLPQKVIRELPEIQSIRAARAQAVAQQQQMEQAQQIAGMVPDMSKAPEPGSPMDQVTDQLANSLPRA